MSFLQTTLSQFLAGVGVAVIVVAFAWLVTDRFAARRARAQARQQRSLAAAEELYRVYGQFFGVWKQWEHAKRKPDSSAAGPAEVRGRLLGEAGQVEGSYESLLVRIAMEQPVGAEDRAALWAMRFALKQLRYAIRQDRALGWWRSDIHPSDAGREGYRQYQAFKSLSTRVATILVAADPFGPAPAYEEGARCLHDVTGGGAFLAPWLAEVGAVPDGSGLPKDAWATVAEALHRRDLPALG
jgi:hypothetical protein